jgi:hypothetical protein
MSDYLTGGSPHPAGRKVLAILGVLLGLALIVAGGTLLTPQAPAFRASRIPLVGRTTTICSATAPEGGKTATATVTAVATRQAPGRSGRLTATLLGEQAPALSITDQGKAEQLPAVTRPVTVVGEGVMATAGSAAILSSAATGVDAGLMAAPCLAPGSTHWFPGVAARNADRTELILTNTDDAQAEVDLRFFGQSGRMVVPGGTGLVIEARSSRTVALNSLIKTKYPLSLAVQASQGRVAATTKRTRNDELRPIGADWQVPSVAPATTVVIPGVPDGEGTRALVVTNPNADRASVQVQLLGLQGPFAPAGAETLDLAPESSATVDLAPGLLGDSAAVKLISDQPVTGAVVSTSRRTAAQEDLAVQSAAAPLVRTGVSAIATTDAGASELVLSNSGTEDTPVSFEVLSNAGVSLRTEDVLLGPDGTATRRLESPEAGYLVVRVPDGSAVVGTVVLTQPTGDIAGLATIPLTSPDVASRAPATIADPSVGR